MWNSLVGSLAILCLTLPSLSAQDAAATTPPAAESPQPATAETPGERDARFAQYMTGAKFVGRFTILGKNDGNMPEEEYTIHKCEKLEQDDMFRFTARIRYGDTDTELPMDLPVKWAGRTPVITLEKLWLPGLGTFSSRVVIHSGRYAGTWDHGDKGGHLFGRIVPAPTAAEPASSSQP